MTEEERLSGELSNYSYDRYSNYWNKRKSIETLLRISLNLNQYQIYDNASVFFAISNLKEIVEFSGFTIDRCLKEGIEER